ncbi:MAG: hypothetical protein ACJ8CB_24695 [Ktedonobacteraceae bacterium]|jgi:hypothetical protein
MAEQEQLTSVGDGWKFQLVNDQLLITAQSDPATQVQLSPQATVALLSYLTNHKDALYWAAYQGARNEPEPDSEGLHLHPDEEDPGF